MLASGSCPSTSRLSTSEFTHCVRGNAPVAAPCQPMNTAEGSDCATARAASIDDRGPAAVPITTSGGRSAGTGASARPPPVGHGAHATRSAATLLPKSGYVFCHCRASSWIWAGAIRFCASLQSVASAAS